MGYIGLRTDTTGTFRTLDDISGEFNNVKTSFNLTFGAAPLVVPDARQLIISLDGVLQQPEGSYDVSGSNIVFTEPPNEGSTFWGYLLGGSYDILNPEFSATTLIDAKFDNSLGPNDGLATLTANTPSYSDTSTKVATTNFSRHRPQPAFKYSYNGSSIIINSDSSKIIDFDDGDLVLSNGLSGFDMDDGELEFPSTYRGVWLISVTVNSGNLGSSNSILAVANIEQWSGSSWVSAALGDVNKAGLDGGQYMSASNTTLLTTTSSADKIRIRVYQKNSGNNTIGFPDCELSGVYLGRDI